MPPSEYQETRVTEHIDSFLSAWTRAECAGDTEKLEGLLADINEEIWRRAG